jgi:hypothetical protein
MVLTGVKSQSRRLKELVAASSTFQGIVHAADATAALQFIHVPTNDEPESSPQAGIDAPPWAIVSDDETADRREKRGVGYWVESGSLMLSLCFYVPAGSDATMEESHEWFMTRIGSIFEEMEALDRQAGPISGETYLAVLSSEKRDGPFPVDPAEFGPMPDLDVREPPGRLWYISYEITY